MKKLNTRLFAFAMLAVTTITTPAMASTVVEPVPVTVPGSTEPTPAEVKAAMENFRALPRKERKERIRDAKKMMKEYRADKRAGKAAETDQVLLAILAILLPPLAVYLKEGEVNSRFWLSLILTLLFWIPGVVYALLVVFDAI